MRQSGWRYNAVVCKALTSCMFIWFLLKCESDNSDNEDDRKEASYDEVRPPWLRTPPKYIPSDSFIIIYIYIYIYIYHYCRLSLIVSLFALDTPKRFAPLLWTFLTIHLIECNMFMYSYCIPCSLYLTISICIIRWFLYLMKIMWTWVV